VDAKQVIHVKIGEVKVGKEGDLLKATLGSCVGIAVLWKSKNRYALAHCLLPESPSTTYQIGGKYVDQAVPSLLSMLGIKADQYGELEVYLAGGGNMMEQLSRRNPHHIGLQNAAAAKKVITGLGIKIKDAMLGGEQAHQISINCTTGQVLMSKLEKPAAKD
jgi:chemotaxis protein CheD